MDVCSGFHPCTFVVSCETSSRRLWWRQSVDVPGQQTAEADRPPRTKGSFLSLNVSLISSYLLLSPSSLPQFLFPICLLSSSRPSALYTPFLKLTTNYGKWIQNNINYFAQQHLPTRKHRHICTRECVERHTADMWIYIYNYHESNVMVILG